MSYNGSIDLISGLRPKNNGTFPLLQAKDVQTREDGTRLDTELEELKKGTGGDTTALEQRVKALEQDSADINTELQGVADRVSDLEKGGTGTDVILVASEADLPDDAEDGTIAVVPCAESEEEESGGESGGSFTLPYVEITSAEYPSDGVPVELSTAEGEALDSAFETGLPIRLKLTFSGMDLVAVYNPVVLFTEGVAYVKTLSMTVAGTSFTIHWQLDAGWFMGVTV